MGFSRDEVHVVLMNIFRTVLVVRAHPLSVSRLPRPQTRHRTSHLPHWAKALRGKLDGSYAQRLPCKGKVLHSMVPNDFRILRTVLEMQKFPSTTEAFCHESK